MDASQALADLTEISSQIQAAVLFAEGGEVIGSTLADDAATAALVQGAGEVLEAAGALRADGGLVTQIEASTPDGSVFVVRDGGRGIVATTAPTPTVGLVFYDLKSCLRGTEVEKPKRRRRSSKQEAPDDAA